MRKNYLNQAISFIYKIITCIIGIAPLKFRRDQCERKIVFFKGISDVPVKMHFI
jgi:hypothetical protein